MLPYLCIYTGKLPGPGDIVQELSVIKAVIIRAVHLSMVTWGQGGHLVSIYSITTEEMLHFFSHLRKKREKLNTYLIFTFDIQKP